MRLGILLAGMLLAASVAHAADVRAIDFTAVLLDQDNEPMSECADAQPDPKQPCKMFRYLTLGTIAMRALAMPEQNLPAEESLKRGQLALRVYRASDAVLETGEIETIKRCIAKAWGPLVVARAFAILDPATIKK